MAPQRTMIPTDVPTPKRRKVRRRRARTNRSGAATGTGNTNQTLSSSGGFGLTADFQRGYQLGQKHACEQHGIPWGTRSTKTL
jgi:hypothetical protein